jgi:hypothetical protein
MQETAILSTTVTLLANLLLLFWRKELSLHGSPVSPWSREFVYYFVVSGACVLGNYCFFQSDQLVAQHCFAGKELDAYMAAGVLARALPLTVAPLLAVLFTSRSGHRAGNIVGEQLKLIGLSAIGLLFGAVCLYALRVFCLKLVHKYSPESADMIGHFALTMVFVGLLQSLAMWALASRWARVSVLYGALGLAYSLVLLTLGKTPNQLLTIMSVTTGVAFVILFAAWLWAMRRHHPVAQS